MNDHDAMTQITAVLDQYFRGEINEVHALARVCIIAGENDLDHEKEAKP